MIIFDMDGTLWYTFKNAYDGALKVASEHDDIREITKETVANGMGLSFVDNAVNYMPYLDKETREKYLAIIDEEVRQNIIRNGATIYDGVIKVITNLGRKYKLGIVTNNTNEYAEIFLRQTSLQSSFVDYMGAATYSISKGEAIRRMMTRNDEPESIYVGDIEKDKIAANEANATFIHARYGFGKKFESEYHIDNIYELEREVNKIIYD